MALSESAETHALDPLVASRAGSSLRASGLWLGVGAITAVAAAFVLHQLMAWPPHEDETLALFAARDTLPRVLEHVMTERGGAPLHFLGAWVVTQLGLGLGGLRLLSATFAVASLPLVAMLALRVAGRREALVAVALAAASWSFLFHSVYGRMYALFLFLSLASLIALLRALDRPTRGRWALWVAVVLLAVAAHPYGALVVAAQGVFVAVARRDRLRAAIVPFGVVLVVGTPFWLTDLVLADRFEVGVGGGGRRLGGPHAVADYLWRVAGDFSAGWWPATLLALALTTLGLIAVRRETRLLAVSLVGVPAAAFLLARIGGSASPESRHLIFLLPLFCVLVAAGLVRTARHAPLAAVAVGALLIVSDVAWAWHRTPALFEWEPDQRQTARGEAEAWLASTSRPDDLLFGYEPLYLGAWERNHDFPRTVLPRADGALAFRTLERQRSTLGRGVWVLDASRRNNDRARLEVEPFTTPPGLDARVFGPFVVLRTREPTRTPEGYLGAAARAQVLGLSLGIGDADVNIVTVERADQLRRGYGPSAWLSSDTSR